MAIIISAFLSVRHLFVVTELIYSVRRLFSGRYGLKLKICVSNIIQHCRNRWQHSEK